MPVVREKAIYSKVPFVLFIVFSMLMCFGFSIFLLTSNLPLLGSSINDYPSLKPLQATVTMSVVCYSVLIPVGIFTIVVTARTRKCPPIPLFTLLFILIYIREFISAITSGFSQYGFYFFNLIFGCLIAAAIVYFVGISKKSEVLLKKSCIVFLIGLGLLFVYNVISLVLIFKDYRVNQHAFYEAAKMLYPETGDDTIHRFKEMALDYLFASSYLIPIFMSVLLLILIPGFISPVVELKRREPTNN